uniref:DUF4371 domain-containing protein n=1 Tax=Pelodiscus sinensis TaxID=13735 RepID=K7GJF8_PELSI
MELGFMWTGNKSESRPLFLLCKEVLSNESLKPAHLQHHHETEHGKYVSKPTQFSENKLKELKETKGSDNAKAVEASYQMTQLIIWTGNPHTIGEELVLLAAKEMVSAMLGDEAGKQIGLILSNNTVRRRIDKMAQNVKEQLTEKVWKSHFYSLQIDETTDIANRSNFLSVVRYQYSGEVQEDCLFCKFLSPCPTGEAIFDVLSHFTREHDINWSKCVGITIDGARAITGQYTGVVTQVKAVAPLTTFIRCSIHREVLAAKMPDDQRMVLDKSVKIVNFIKARPLNSRLFAALCDKMDSDHSQLLHTEIHWLSRGKFLSHLLQLRDEVRIFFAHHFELTKLAYLANIFSYRNGLNLSVQRKAVTIFHVHDKKIDAMIKNFDLWIAQLDQSNYDSFPNLSYF